MISSRKGGDMVSSHEKRRKFALILGGGGARGFAHIGVLRGLERRGWHPSGIVGVSMGAVVGAAYALREDWYPALMDFAAEGFPGASSPLVRGPAEARSRLRQLASGAKAVWDLGHGWGAGDVDVDAGRRALDTLLGSADLGEGRIPVSVSATDLLSGDRVVMREGPAAQAVYASSALAGILPPERLGPYVLADGAYTDICPIDVARQFDCACVVAVNPGRSPVVHEIGNGLQGLMRATEICYLHHAALRFDEADVLLTPPFRRAVDMLEFHAYRECIAAGICAVRQEDTSLRRLLEPAE
jgi:NTE family protein